MKKILVPTDFSDCADSAVELGFAFAEFFDAELHLYTCIDISSKWLRVSEKEQADLMKEKQLEKNANTLLNVWREKATEEGIQLKTIVSAGKFLDDLEEQVQKNDIDFIVMGSHGVSGKEEYFMGSNTQKAVRKLHVPIFVIKNPLKEYAFRNVVYASSFNVSDREPFQRFLDFIKWFSPETIHLLTINTSGWFGQPSLLMNEAMADFKEMCKHYSFETQTHFYKDIGVEQGVRHFAEENNADLIAVSNHNRHPLKRIFSGSSVEALVNHCEVPVLSIDY